MYVVIEGINRTTNMLYGVLFDTFKASWLILPYYSLKMRNFSCQQVSYLSEVLTSVICLYKVGTNPIHATEEVSLLTTKANK